MKLHKTSYKIFQKLSNPESKKYTSEKKNDRADITFFKNTKIPIFQFRTIQVMVAPERAELGLDSPVLMDVEALSIDDVEVFVNVSVNVFYFSLQTFYLEKTVLSLRCARAPPSVLKFQGN